MRRVLIIVAVVVVILSLLLIVLCGFQHRAVNDEGVDATQAITVIMPTYNRRIHLVKETIAEYEAMPVVEKVIVLEFDTGENRTSHENAVILPNDLRHRFAPENFSLMTTEACPHITSEAVFITDDDAVVNERLLRALVGKMRRDPTALHGIEGRILDSKGRYKAVHRPRLSKTSREVPVLLTWCVLANTETMRQVSHKFEQKYFDCAKPLNGEDIAVSMLFDRAIMHDDGWYTFYGFPVYNPNFHFKTNVSSLSNKPGFVRERAAITRNFQRVIANPDASCESP